MLNPFFKSEGVAVIGASRNPHKLGYGVVRNLKEYRYQGGIYPVNKSASEILDLPCFETVAEVPDPVDLAIIIVPTPVVSTIMKQCGERGIRHAVVISGGFSETGEEGRELEEEVASISNPMVLFGTGGTDVELLQDVESAVAPLNRLQAEKLIDATRAGIKLKGWRKQPSADRETVIKYLIRLPQLGEDMSNINELEMNPLYVMAEGQGAYAVDVRGTVVEEEKVVV